MGWIMSEEISRRSFLSGSLLGLAALSISLASGKKSAAKKKEGPLHVDVDHSGQDLDDTSVGVLVVANAPKHLDTMRRLRKDLQYFRPLRHNSTDLRRVPYGNALIDYFLKTDDMRFVAVVTSHGSPRLDDLAVALKHLRKGGLGASLDPAVLARAAAVRKGLKGVAADEIGQLADVLTGAVYVDFSRSPSQRRSEFAKALKQKLKASRLAPFNGHPRFSVITG